MPRLVMLCCVVAMALAACGVITVTLPGSGDPRGTKALPKGYERLSSPAPHAFRASLPGEPVRRGARSERYELRDGDCGGKDCASTWYRSEIREDPKAVQARIGDDIWYGWSFYNANIGSVSRDTSLGAVFGQWRVGGDRPPVFRITQTAADSGNWAACDAAVCNRAGDPLQDVVVELNDMAAASGWGRAQNDGAVCRLFSMAQNQGRWVDIVVNTNFSADTNGYLRIWVNGEMACNYYGRLVADPAARKGDPGPSHRRGIFASYTERWTRTQGTAPKPTMIVHYDEFRAGPTRADVDPRDRETAGLPPVD